jgi:hypothetical protein
MKYPILDDKTYANAPSLIYRDPDHPFHKNHPKRKIAEDICKNIKIIDPWNRKKNDTDRG